MRKEHFTRSKAVLQWTAGLLFIGVIAAFIFCSCVRDDLDRPGGGSGDEVRITLTIEVPGGRQTASGSRAMPADEGTVNQVHVLLFRPSGGPLVGAYPAVGAIETDPGDPTKKSFTVDVIEGTFDLMVLANSGAAVSAAGLARDMFRSEVGNRLWAEQTGKFDVTGSALFPFWGQMNNAVITDGATLGEIPVLRAMARIDVVLWTDEVRDEFHLETVTVYHWQNRMALIPEHYNAAQEAVTSATVTGSGLSATTLAYSGGDIDSARHIKSKIYLNETRNPGEGAFPELPCLILGGYYRGEMRYYRVDFFQREENDTRTYHDLLRNHHYELRVEKILTNGSGSEQEAYESTVVNIETSIQVWNESDNKNIIVDGEYWLRVDPAEFELAREAHEATPDSRAERFSLDDYFFEIESNTNWTIDPNSIVYSPTEQNDWFSLNNRGVSTDWSGAPHTVADMEIVVTENTTEQERKATFTVEAGTIRFPVTVTQTTERMTWIQFYHMDGNPWNGELDILSRADHPGEFEFIVEWYPADWPCEVTVTPDGGFPGLIPYENGYEMKSTTLAGGRHHYHLNKMKRYEDSEIDKNLLQSVSGSDDFTFKVGNETKSGWFCHYLTHLYYQSDPYRLDIPKQRFNFTTTAASVVKEVRDPHDILTAEAKSRIENFSYGTNPAFTPLDHSIDLAFKESTAAKDAQKVWVTFSFPYTPGMPDKTVELEAHHLQPNSYMVKPGGSLHIPIRKVYRVWKNEPLFTPVEPVNLSVELIWQDASSVVTEIALTPEYTKDGWDSEIFVRLGSDEGNAVVALKQGGEILWSWHVWSSLYDPDNGGSTYVVNYPELRSVYMDRNLGAIRANSATPEDIKYSQGLFYQYCRKDPFPPMEQYVDYPGQENYDYLEHRMNTYDINGNPHPRGKTSTQVWNRRQITSNTEKVNVTLSIQNPTLFLTSGPPAYNWFSTDPSKWPWLWWGPVNYEYFKSEYDPCPDGWKITDIPVENETIINYGEEDERGPSTEHYGYVFQNMGYVPASGIMDFATGDASNYKGVGKWFALWCHSADMESGVDGNLTRYQIFANIPLDMDINTYAPPQYPSMYPAAGLNVRCMRYDLSRYDSWLADRD